MRRRRPTLVRAAVALGFAAIALARSAADAEIAPSFAVFALTFGAATIWEGVARGRRPLLFSGAAGAGAGMVLIAADWIGPHALPHVVGAWAMWTGVLELFAAGGEKDFSARAGRSAAGVCAIALAGAIGIVPEWAVTRLPELLTYLLGASGMFLLIAARPPRREPPIAALPGR